MKETEKLRITSPEEILQRVKRNDELGIYHIDLSHCIIEFDADFPIILADHPRESIYTIDANSSDFKGFVSFSGLTLQNRARFVGATFGNEADFTRTTFGSKALFELASFGKRAGFAGAKFGDEANFRNTTFGDMARFVGASFGVNATFKESTFGDKAIFHRAVFGSGACFDEATIGNEANFIKTTFGDGAGFISASFMDKADFSNATFGDGVDFEGATFGEKISFYQTTFLGKSTWNRITMGDRGYFGWTNFNGVVEMKSSVINGNIRFMLRPESFSLNLYGTLIFGNLLFQGSDIKFLKLRYTQVGGHLNLSCCKIRNLELDGCAVDNNIILDDIELKQSNRNTFRVLKYYLSQQKDFIKAIDYHRREMESFDEELRRELCAVGKERLVGVARLKAYGERLMLWLNRHSNEFGSNWPLGVWFTLYISLSAFTLYQVFFLERFWEFGWDGWGEFSEVFSQWLKYYATFINPVHDLSFMETGPSKPMGLAYIVDFLSRIFITYGYYQTVAAFRKYGKW